MFIKKDLRKIPEILADAAARAAAASLGEEEGGSGGGVVEGEAPVVLRSLHLSKRPDEFRGTIKVLCEPESSGSRELLQQLESLSLYDCGIESIDGIGFAMPHLHDLSVGRNPLSQLPHPNEMQHLSHTLQRLWLDDCQLAGPLPDGLLELSNLHELRLSHNQLTSLPDNLHYQLAALQVLCVDHNQLDHLPLILPPSLKTLQVRENHLTHLPPLPGTLQHLHASSNALETLEDPTNVLSNLTHVYLNRNCLTSVPDFFVNQCPQLGRLNVSHNKIATVSSNFLHTFGAPDVATGFCTTTCDNTPSRTRVVLLGDNPVVQTLADEARLANMEIEAEVAAEGPLLVEEGTTPTSTLPPPTPMVTA